jgi:hypothetical protein
MSCVVCSRTEFTLLNRNRVTFLWLSWSFAKWYPDYVILVLPGDFVVVFPANAGRAVCVALLLRNPEENQRPTKG